MSNHYYATLIKQHPSMPARIMQMQTPHGEILTPAFMPVGTKATLNYLTIDDLQRNGSQIILGGNTYHMLCAPGMETLKALGGMHPFMGWQKPMLTDSGGFQVFSLAKGGNICIVDEKGAVFKHPITGKIIHLNAETSISAQKIIGADIMMAFDECTPEEGGRERALMALQRTHRWLLRSQEAHAQSSHSVYGYKQALFGIIQGGSFRDLREESAAFIVSQDLDGIAIGGEVIGFNMEKTLEIIDWVRPLLPPHKIRYTMGVGLNPQDLLDVVAKGIDIFDCVAPTRNARHGTLYQGELVKRNDWFSFEGKHILIKKSQYAKDENPVMKNCACYTCKHFTRAYLHYLFKEKMMAYTHLASIHNIHVMQFVCEKMRELIMTCSQP